MFHKELVFGKPSKTVRVMRQSRAHILNPLPFPSVSMLEIIESVIRVVVLAYAKGVPFRAGWQGHENLLDAHQEREAFDRAQVPHLISFVNYVQEAWDPVTANLCIAVYHKAESVLEVRQGDWRVLTDELLSMPWASNIASELSRQHLTTRKQVASHGHIRERMRSIERYSIDKCCPLDLWFPFM